MGLLAGLWIAVPAWGQWGDRKPVARDVDTVTNLFASVDLTRAAETFRLALPPDWDVRSVSVLRYGVTPVQATVEPEQRGAYRVRTASPIRGPHEVVVQVKTGSRRGAHTWSLAPLDTDASGQVQPRTGRDVRHRVVLEASPTPNPENRALAFAPGAEAALQIRPEVLPPWTSASSFTVECWVQTLGRDEVLLSTWSGNERDAYLMDVVVDPSGRVRSYFGRPGQHRALVSTAPVADGQWHHVALAYAAPTRTLRLLLDGTVVDSLQGASLPMTSGSPRLAVGGRVAPSGGARAPARFSGRLDEVRLWAHNRSPFHIRETMRHSVESVPGWRFVLGVDDATPDATPDAVGRWPAGVQRVPSTRPLQPPLQDLQAVVDDQAVHLHWSAAAQGVRAFIIERSGDGRTFEEVARVAPQDVAVSSAHGASRAPLANGASFANETPQFAFVDDSAPGRVVYYRIRQENENGTAKQSATLKIGRGARDASPALPRLMGNFPNPFVKTTTITYELQKAVPVTLTVWNLTGNRIAQLVDGVQERGRHEVAFDANNLPSGTYFVRMETPSGVQSHRMVLLR